MNRLKILIAEDEQLVMMGIKRHVEVLGHEVIGEAVDGDECVRLAASLRPDVILMDINLPKVDGIEAARQINASVPTPVVVITGYSQPELINRAKNAGVYAYLVKPVDEDDIGPALEIAMSRFQEVQHLRQDLSKTMESLEMRKYIERAKGIVQDLRKLTEAEAMRFLQKRSRDTNKKLVDVAKEIIEAYETLWHKAP